MKKNSKLPNWGYRLLKPILGPIYRFYYHPKIEGKENIPKEGPIIIVGNHKHLMDQCSVIISTRRVVHYMAKKEYFDNKKVAWFFKLTGVISVDRSIHDEESKKKAIKVLEDGGAIGLFPEGTRNKTDSFLLPFKFGAVSMAQKTGALIIPFGVTGDYKFRSKNLKLTFGKPLKVDKDDDLGKVNKKLEKLVGDLMKKNLKEK